MRVLLQGVLTACSNAARWRSAGHLESVEGEDLMGAAVPLTGGSWPALKLEVL